MNKPRSFRQLVSSPQSGGVERLIQRSGQLLRLDTLVRDLLGSGFAEHCRVANIKGNSLLLHVDSTVWATRIRYQLPELLRNLQQTDQLRQITEIDLRVQPRDVSEAVKKPIRKAAMSRDAALCVKECASSIEDEQLRGALQRLASRGGIKS